METRERRPRVIYWDTLPAPYDVERYNEVANRGAIALTVWFARRSEPGRAWAVDESSWRFQWAYVEDPGRSAAGVRRFVERCRHAQADLMVSAYGEWQFVVGQALMKAIGLRTALIIHPTFDAWIRRAWYREAAKHLLFRSADAAEVPGPDGLRHAERYGMPAARVSMVRQSTNVAHFAQPLSEGDRARVRQELGISGCAFLCVGRLWKGKGVLTLLEAFRQARREAPDSSLLLVGDGVDESEIRGAARDLPGVAFHSFVQARELARVYAAADVFVFPTLGDPHGQVVEEAHAAGLPVIATEAAGDIRRRVVEGVSGYIVPAGNQDALADRMVCLARDGSLRAAMGARGAARVASWTHADYAVSLERFVDAALALPRRRTLAGAAMKTAGVALLGGARLTHP